MTEERPAFYRIAWFFYLALAVLGLIGLGSWHGELGVDLLVDPGSWWTDVGIGLGLGAILLGLWWLATRFSAGARRVESELGALVGTMNRSEAAALALLSALAEEIAFRGALQAWLGWPAAAFLFALAHIGPGRHFRWWTLWALVGGTALGLVTAGRGSLGAAILAHLTVNAVQLQRFSSRKPPAAVVEAEAPEAEDSAADAAKPAPVPPSDEPEPPATD